MHINGLYNIHNFLHIGLICINIINEYMERDGKSFCYLEDFLGGDGGADLDATARIRNGWKKFRELGHF